MINTIIFNLITKWCGNKTNFVIKIFQIFAYDIIITITEFKIRMKNIIEHRNVLKLILESPRFVPFGTNLAQFGCQIRHPWVGLMIVLHGEELGDHWDPVLLVEFLKLSNETILEHKYSSSLTNLFFSFHLFGKDPNVEIHVRRGKKP